VRIPFCPTSELYIIKKYIKKLLTKSLYFMLLVGQKIHSAYLKYITFHSVTLSQSVPPHLSLSLSSVVALAEQLCLVAVCQCLVACYGVQRHNGINDYL